MKKLSFITDGTCKKQCQVTETETLGFHPNKSDTQDDDAYGQYVYRQEHSKSQQKHQKLDQRCQTRQQKRRLDKQEDLLGIQVGGSWTGMQESDESQHQVSTRYPDQPSMSCESSQSELPKVPVDPICSNMRLSKPDASAMSVCSCTFECTEDMDKLIDGKLLEDMMKSFYNAVATATNSEGHAITDVFMKLPCKREYAVYYKVIKNPMDLKMVYTRLKGMQWYESLEDLYQDLQLIFTNATSFNQVGSEIHNNAKILLDIMAAKYGEIQKKKASNGSFTVNEKPQCRCGCHRALNGTWRPRKSPFFKLWPFTLRDTLRKDSEFRVNRNKWLSTMKVKWLRQRRIRRGQDPDLPVIAVSAAKKLEKERLKCYVKVDREKMIHEGETGKDRLKGVKKEKTKKGKGPQIIPDTGPAITLEPTQLRVSSARMEHFLDTMVERERIRERRERGLPKPWTQDPTYQTNKFCNVFRDDDRQTRNFFAALREQQLSPEDIVAHCIVFRMFNLCDTYQAIKHHITWENFDAIAMRATLDGKGPWSGTDGKPGVMFSDAYLIPARFGGEPTCKGLVKRHLIVDRFAKILVPANRTLLRACRSSHDFFELTRDWLYRGSKEALPFINYQVICYSHRYCFTK